MIMMMKAVLCPNLFLLCLLHQVAFISGQEISACDTMRLEGPYIWTLKRIMGAVYTKTNSTYNRRPVFDHQLNSFASYVYYCSACSRWIIGPVVGGTNVSMYTSSNASHPVDVEGTWFANVFRMYRPFHDIALRCIKTQYKANNCSSIRLETGSIFKHISPFGAIFHMEVFTNDGRPVFSVRARSKMLYYIAYADMQWSISSTNHTRSLRAASTASHPADIYALWYDVTNVTSVPLKNVSITCADETCEKVTLQGPYIQSQSSIMGAVFTQTGEIRDDRPVFKFGSGNNSVYMIYNDQYAEWKITPNISTSSTKLQLYASSIANHPVQVTGWYVIEDGRSHQRYDVSVDCSAATSNRNNCSAVTLQGPFIESQSALVGAVFKVNTMKDGKPVFKLRYRNYTSDADVYLSYDNLRVSWQISNDLSSNRNSFYARSTANHPVDVKAVWWYVDTHGRWKAAENSSFVCSKVPSTASNSCNIIESFNSPYGHRFLRKIDAIFNDRSVYVIKVNKTTDAYLYYFEHLSAWVIGTSLGHPTNVIAQVRSKETNPTNIRGIWYFWTLENNKVHLAPYEDTFFQCKNERTENCTFVRIAGSKNMKLPGVSEDVYKQIDTDVHKKPIFYVRDLNTTSYIYHKIGNNQIAYWCVGPSLNSTATLKSVSDDQHPSDTTHPWTLFDGENIMNIYEDIHIDCATEQNQSQGTLQPDFSTIIAVVVATFILIMGAMVVGYIWNRKRYLLSNLFQPYNELEDAEFDAFICFKSGGPGQRFALDYIVPRLEADWGLRVATDVPNYLPGCEFIEAEAALQDIESSRRIILILTYDFLDCRWCNIKCTSALVQREKRLAAIVPVLLEDISTSERRSQKLKTIMNISKCLRIPSTFEGPTWEHFLRSLRHALPKNRSPPQEHTPSAQDAGSENTVLEGPRVDAMEKELQQFAFGNSQTNVATLSCNDPSNHENYCESTF